MNKKPTAPVIEKPRCGAVHPKQPKESCYRDPNHTGMHMNRGNLTWKQAKPAAAPETAPQAAAIDVVFEGPNALREKGVEVLPSPSRKKHEEPAPTALVKHEEPAYGALSVEKARELLATSKNMDEVRDIRDKAQAIATYQRMRGASIDSQNDAAEIRMRAERRLGELTVDLEREQGKRSDRLPAKSAGSSKAAKLAELGLKDRDARRYEQLAKIPAKKFEDLVTETKAKGERLTSNAPLKMVRQEAKARLAAELRAKPIPQANGRFDVIVIDPPWFYEKRADDITQRGQIGYPPMTQDELLVLPVPDRAEKNCVLWCWTTNAFLEDAIALGKHWGFTRKTMMTWGKGRIDEDTGEWVDHMANGDWLRGETEHCLMFVKGSPTVTLTNQTTLLLAPSREHSRKPDEFYERVDGLCPGTKLDMFAREPREGWVLWGNDTQKFKTEAA